MKPILIIVPGWGGTRVTWADFIARAAAHYDVHCIEMPCFGEEPCPTTVWGVEEYAEFLKDKIQTIKDRANGAPMYVLAHSFGGQIAVKMLSKDPMFVKGLLLSGPAIFRRQWTLKNLLFLPLAKLGTILFSLPGLRALQTPARRVLYKLAASPDYNQTKGVQRRIFQKVTRQDVAHLLPALDLPTVLVAGSRDRYVRARDTKRAGLHIPKARFVLVRGGRHGLHHTHPEVLLDQLKTLLP